MIGDNVTKGTQLQCIGWRPAYDVAYVKRLEFDRANLNSRDLQHSQMVKSYKFQMESSRDYHRSIEKTNEVHELRIKRLMRELRRERDNNGRLQQENVSLWRRVVSLQMEVAIKDRELAQTQSAKKSPCASDPAMPLFEVLSQGFNETSSNINNTNPPSNCALNGTDHTIEGLTKELNSTRAKLAMCEEQLETLQQEKFKTVTELQEKYNRLQKEFNAEKRTVDSMRDMCAILRRKSDEEKQKSDEASKREEMYKEQIAKANLMYEDVVLKMRVVQARLETMQPPLLAQNVVLSPPTMIKNI